MYIVKEIGFLLSIPRALGGFIGAIWPPGNYQDDYTAYEFILNTDSKVNLVGRVPLLEDLGVTDLQMLIHRECIQLSKMINTISI